MPPCLRRLSFSIFGSICDCLLLARERSLKSLRVRSVPLFRWCLRNINPPRSLLPPTLSKGSRTIWISSTLDKKRTLLFRPTQVSLKVKREVKDAPRILKPTKIVFISKGIEKTGSKHFGSHQLSITEHFCVLLHTGFVLKGKREVKDGLRILKPAKIVMEPNAN